MVERERERWKAEKHELERVKNEMKCQIDELKSNLRQSTEKIEELEQKQKVKTNFWSCFLITTIQKKIRTQTPAVYETLNSGIFAIRMCKALMKTWLLNLVGF